MLDSNKENLKLDAMKRIVGMIAKGKNASDLFPAVVKNVVSKNVEVTFTIKFSFSTTRVFILKTIDNNNNNNNKIK